MAQSIQMFSILSQEYNFMTIYLLFTEHDTILIPTFQNQTNSWLSSLFEFLLTLNN